MDDPHTHNEQLLIRLKINIKKIISEIILKIGDLEL
jgi:hypothetical protein